MIDNNKPLDLKSYSDTYLYSKYPLYTKRITSAIMNDPVIEKKTDAFQDVVYEIKRTRVSESLVRILNSVNVVLLDCDDPMPRAFKVFCAKDIKTGDKKLKIFIDCTNVITKSKKSSDLIVNESALISHLINAGVTMIYHKLPQKILSRSTLIQDMAKCYAKCFTYVIDYLVKVSIQETNKAKVMYLTSMFFYKTFLNYSDDRAVVASSTIADINTREANMINILMDKATHIKGVPEKDTDPYRDLKSFIRAMRTVMHFNKGITEDVVVERWMHQFGPGTVFGMEYLPAFSAMMTDAYIGGFLNNQRTIENICKVDMVNYSKAAINMLDNVV